jgi:hypothetical protein
MRSIERIAHGKKIKNRRPTLFLLLSALASSPLPFKLKQASLYLLHIEKKVSERGKTPSFFSGRQ